MKIKIENGSIIESIESSESKRSRGYRVLVNPIDDYCDYSMGENLTDEKQYERSSKHL